MESTQEKKLEAVEQLLKQISVQELREDIEELFMGFIRSDYADHPTSRCKATATFTVLKEFLEQIQ